MGKITGKATLPGDKRKKGKPGPAERSGATAYYRPTEPVQKLIRIHPDISNMINDFASEDRRGMSNAIGKLVELGYTKYQEMKQADQEIREAQKRAEIDKLIQK